MTKTYLQLAREIATLQAAADRQLAAEKKEAVARLNEVIAKYDLSAADLKFPGTGISSATPGPKPKPTSKSAVSGAKYADGSGNTWGGRGPRPAWLRNAIASGKSLESFTGSAASAAQPVAEAASASASAVPGKKAGSTVAPKYRHPVLGDTWSGRGSAPRWLKEALRKRGTKLDDFLIAKPAGTGSASSPVKASKSAAASKPKLAASTKSMPKPVAAVKAAAAEKAVVSKTSPKNASAARKTIAKTSAKTPMPAPVVAPAKTPAAKKQAVAAPQRVATKTRATPAKPARKAVAAKKTAITKPAPAANAGVPAAAAAAASVSSLASETPAASPFV